MDNRTNEQIIAEVTGAVVGRKQTRRKPSRCLGCGKVSRAIFCPACTASRRTAKDA